MDRSQKGGWNRKPSLWSQSSFALMKVLPRSRVVFAALLAMTIATGGSFARADTLERTIVVRERAVATILDGAYRADSTGRRNTFDHILFEQLVECFRGRSPSERFAWPRIQGMGNGVQLFIAMLT